MYLSKECTIWEMWSRPDKASKWPRVARSTAKPATCNCAIRLAIILKDRSLNDKYLKSYKPASWIIEK